MMTKRNVKRHGGGLPPLPKEVLFEFKRLGHILRVVAIDPQSATEVTMIADPRQPETTIKMLAARKLAYVLDKKRAKLKHEQGRNRLR